MANGKFNAGGFLCNGLASHPGKEGAEILIASSCYRNQDKLQQYRPLVWPDAGTYAQCKKFDGVIPENIHTHPKDGHWKF